MAVCMSTMSPSMDHMRPPPDSVLHLNLMNSCRGPIHGTRPYKFLAAKLSLSLFNTALP